MSKTLHYTGQVMEDGKVKLHNGNMRKEIKKMFSSCVFSITVSKHYNRRSKSQNAYYWGVIIPYIIEAFIDLGHDLQVGNTDHHDTIHSFLKQKFLNNGLLLSDVNGEAIQLPPSTKTLTTLEFRKYEERIKRWAAEFLSVVIPDAGQAVIV